MNCTAPLRLWREITSLMFAPAGGSGLPRHRAATRWCAPAIPRQRQGPRHRSIADATPNPISALRSAGLKTGAGSMWKCPSTINSAAHDIASAKANATTRREAESAASSGMTTSQTAAKDSMPPVVDRDHHDETRQRQRRQDMRAVVTAGARQEPGQQDRRDQPGEGRDLERGGRTAHRQIDRKRREGGQAAEQPRRHEGAMARARQRVISCRRMQQRIETIADDTQNTHGSCASACSSGRFFADAPERPLYLCAHRVRANLSER